MRGVFSVWLCLVAVALGQGQSTTNLSTLTSPASGDLIKVVDVSDTTFGPGGTDKKLTIGNLSLAITPTFSQITGKPTTLLGYGITDAQGLDADLTALASASAGGAGTFWRGDATWGSLMNAETLAFRDRVIAAGGSLSAFEMAALDQHINDGKRDGWWVKMVEVWPFMGSNLAAATTKLVYFPAAGGALTNTGFVEADYALHEGFGVLSGAKYLNSGLIPTNAGLTTRDAAFGGFVLDETSATSRSVIVANQDESTSQLSFLGSYYITGSGVIGWASRTYAISASLGAGARFQIKNGVKLSSTSALALSGLSSTEVTAFRHMSIGVTSDNPAKIGYFFISTGLTETELRAHQLSMTRLQRAIRRKVQRPAALWLGDSISVGYALAAPSIQAYPNIVAQKMGWALHDSAMASMQLRSAVGEVQALHSVYSGALGVMPEKVVIAIGINDLANDANANGDATIIADFTTKLTAMVQAFLDIGSDVTLCSVFYVTGHNNTKHEAYAAAGASVASAKGVKFCDMYHMVADNPVPTDLLSDNVHLNALGHSKAADRLLAAERGVLFRQPSLDFGSIAAQTAADLTVTMYGARAGDSVTVSVPVAYNSGLTAIGWVSANDTVTVRVTNATTGAIDPAAGYFTVSVRK